MSFTWKMGLAGISLVGLLAASGVMAAEHGTHPVARRAGGVSAPIRVMALGSSVAEGWDDPQGGGYLPRAFKAYSEQSGYKYDLINKSQAGDWAAKVLSVYPDWLAQVKPQVVLITWGLLDDLNHKTTLSEFRAAVAREIGLALANHDVVLVVTPPVTRATYTQYARQEPLYASAELDVAKGFHSPNVYAFDLLDQMEAYLKAHHQTYKPYMADGWHPNAAGHILAGQLLDEDLNSAFGKKPIQFQ